MVGLIQGLAEALVRECPHYGSKSRLTEGIGRLDASCICENKWVLSQIGLAFLDWHSIPVRLLLLPSWMWKAVAARRGGNGV